MALARLLASRLEQTLSSPRVQLGRLAPFSYGLLTSFSTKSGDTGGKEVAVETTDGKKKRWRSLLPRRLQRRRDSLWRNDPRDLVPSFTDLFNTGLGSSLLEASQNINRLFDNIAPASIVGRIKEKDDSYKLRYEVPGLTKEDLKITIDDGVLNIVGEHREEEGDESDDEFWAARRYGFYNTSMVLPEDAKHDDIKAELKDGVLTIVVPKDEKKAKQVKEVKIH